MKKNDLHPEKNLYSAFLHLRSEEEVARFLADLCTPGEVADFAERWAIAQLLNQGEQGYRDIATKVGASTTTVARVARFLNQEQHKGYRLVLDRIKTVK